MSDMRLEVDTESCLMGWGPCVESYNFSHACKKKRGHEGAHICDVCGSVCRAVGAV